MSRSANMSVSVATPADAPRLLDLRTAVAGALTRKYGVGHWSSCPTENAVMRDLETSRVLVARMGAEIVGTVRLAAKKPWAIDVTYFTDVPKAVYLHALAVAPEAQNHAIGTRLIEEAKEVARQWPSDAIRLDAYDAAAGAAPFYVKCGFREVGRATYRGVPLIYLEVIL